MEIQLISTEKIKPASATPDHLRIYKISLLDQFMSPVNIPLVLYFSDGGGEESIQLLKDSLSVTLATFYPFAGVSRDHLSADCNDEGVLFSVAKVNGNIRDFLQNPNFELMNKFFPSIYNPEMPVAPGDNVMMIQLNCFDCGGMAMSIVCSHFVADLASVCTFVRSWAANARGSGEEQVTATMNCIARSSFPQKVSVPMELIPSLAIIKFMSVGKFVTARYVFDTSALSTLKAESRSSAVPTPTRVGVVTALIWKCFMSAVAEKSAVKSFLMVHAVNLRGRAAPPFPKNSFGNFVWLACSTCTNHEEMGLKELVAEGKKAIAKIDEEFMKRMEGDGSEDHNLSELFGELWKEKPQEAQGLVFTSWVNNGLYEVDFGWGKPVWMSRNKAQDDPKSETMLPNHFVVLMDKRDGDGIEAWVTLDKKYVEGFQNNELIRKYARLNPSVI